MTGKKPKDDSDFIDVEVERVDEREEIREGEETVITPVSEGGGSLTDSPHAPVSGFGFWTGTRRAKNAKRLADAERDAYRAGTERDQAYVEFKVGQKHVEQLPSTLTAEALKIENELNAQEELATAAVRRAETEVIRADIEQEKAREELETIKLRRKNLGKAAPKNSYKSKLERDLEEISKSEEGYKIIAETLAKFLEEEGVSSEEKLSPERRQILRRMRERTATDGS